MALADLDLALLLREAAVKEAVTVDLVRRLKDYLGQAQAQPAVRFDAQP